MQWLATEAHWTAKGPNSYGDHLLFQRLYEGVGDPIDELGERLVAYFGHRAVTPEIIRPRAKQLIEAASPDAKGLIKVEQSLQRHIKKAWKANQASGDEMSLGLDDWLMSLSDKRDTAIYLLQQRLGGKPLVPVRSNPRRSGRAERYAWMPLRSVLALVPLMEAEAVSEVARSPRGFLTAYRRAGGDPKRLGSDSYSGQDWVKRRNNFVARHMGQILKRSEPLWVGSQPSRRHLALIAWGFTPDPDGVRGWLRGSA